MIYPLKSFSKFSFIAALIFSASICSTNCHAEDINGTWHFDYGYDMTFTGSGNTFTGTGSSGSITWIIINGVINGNNVSWREEYQPGGWYWDERTGTINGDTITGTFTDSSNYTANFVANRISGGGGSGSGGGSSGGNKRPTAISLFCNRNGVGLSNADCSVTVADKGAPPRSAPTGVVNFTATNGFFPGSGSCSLQQTQYSPGIVSCTAQFAVPNGFPIGAKFPIDATYPGDTAFSGSSTSHELIQAGCVGDQNNPCSGAVALSFANIPQVLRNTIAAIAGCGGGNAPRSLPAVAQAGLFGGCRISIDMNGDVARMLTSLNLDTNMCAQMANSISNADATDQTLRALRDMFRNAAGSPSYLEEIKFDPELMNAELQRIMRQNQNTRPARMRANNSLRPLQAKKRIIAKMGTVTSDVKHNKQKGIKVKLNKLGKGLVKALKAGGISTMNIDMKMKSERLGVVPKGVKKKVSSTTSLDVVL